MATTFPLLSVQGLHARYGDAIRVLHDVSLSVPENGIVALLGANGAGKSTTLKAISNLLGASRGKVTAGTVHWRGKPTLGRSPGDLVEQGVVQVLEGRHCFAHLSVDENLASGGFVRRPSGKALRADLDRIYAWFPRLAQRRQVRAGLLSGGEQQMLAIGRALMTRPTLMLLDEPSMGLAPMMVEEIFDIIGRLNREERMGFLLAEQNANLILRYAHHAYVLENGHVALSGTAADLLAGDDISRFYLGDAAPNGTAPTGAAPVGTPVGAEAAVR